MSPRFVFFSAALALAMSGCLGSSPGPNPLMGTTENGLSWPIDCVLGETCHIGNFTDIDKDGKNAFCDPIGIKGHEGTDIGISHEQMQQGVAVYAAADGVVKFAFDGKFDDCPNANEPDCSDQGSAACTGSGPYCGTDAGFTPGPPIGTESADPSLRDFGPESYKGSCGWCFAGANVLVIRHNDVPGVFATRYDHLKKFSLTVKVGDVVKRGQKIAEVASAGHSTGPHLHFEVWGRGYYDPIDVWQGPCNNLERSLWTADALERMGW